jgi:hypothetical protein
MYVFNFKNESGFVVVSADKRLEPILAFSPKGKGVKLETEQDKTMFDNWAIDVKQAVEVERTSKNTLKKEIGDVWQTYTILPCPAGEECRLLITVQYSLKLNGGKARDII